ncbi:hypothetical protein F4823DRAFT_564889 [Ustulina deusta]|nr:hypothetical protein F4823DRAFT_564889 [Ustulina deusta]
MSSPPRFSKVPISGATVTLAMRDISKTNEWMTPEEERAAGLQRIAASLDNPDAVGRAVRETGAEAAFVYAVPTDDNMRGVFTALRDAPSDPTDIGHVAGALLVSPRGGDRASDVMYLHGPALLSKDEQWAIINRALAAAGRPPVKINHVTAGEFLANLATMRVTDAMVRSFCKSMVDKQVLYAAEDYEAARGNVELTAGRAPTSFEDFVRREIPYRYPLLQGGYLVCHTAIQSDVEVLTNASGFKPTKNSALLGHSPSKLP